MTRVALRGALAGAVVMLGGLASAGEPLLPSPRPLVAEVVGPVGFVRPDPYAAWQNYGVDRSGRFRPLVAPSYGGLRYVYNGEPYPWWPNYPGSVTPTVANAATFAGAPAQPPLLVLPPAPAVLPAPSPTGWERMPYAEK
jgi:hypothetical protein